MIILTLRTDKPEAELGIYDDLQQLTYFTWEAHRQLAETLHQKIREILDTKGSSLNDIGGIVVFEGPGSFTGLRIGISVANALAHSLQIPVVASSDNWIESGIERLLSGESDKIALPKYGAPVHITKQRK